MVSIQEYARQLAAEAPPLTEEQVEVAARVFATAGVDAWTPLPHLDQVPPPPAPRCALYRHWDADGNLLYVGISNEPEGRGRSHRRHSAFMEFTSRSETSWFDTREEASAAERQAIRDEAPLFNRVHSDDSRDRRLVDYLLQRQAYHLLKLP